MRWNSCDNCPHASWRPFGLGNGGLGTSATLRPQYSRFHQDECQSSIMPKALPHSPIWTPGSGPYTPGLEIGHLLADRPQVEVILVRRGDFPWGHAVAAELRVEERPVGQLHAHALPQHGAGTLGRDPLEDRLHRPPEAEVREAMGVVAGQRQLADAGATRHTS